ncbi:MAG: N-acetylmuramic acid 6-phosphate etherase [Rhizobiaceae bacterium]
MSKDDRTTTATEARATQASLLDGGAPDAALHALLDGQVAAANVIAHAIPAIQNAANAVTQAVSNGRKLIYVGAGSSGLMAIADGLELPGTFGITREQICLVMAGGTASFSDIVGASDEYSPEADLRAHDINQQDCAILVSASGSTPYTVSAINHLKALGVTCIAIANNPDTPLLEAADIGILLATPPEVLAGSTRLGAGTAQKITLNMLSTLAGIQLGHVHEGHMVNVIADNEKLKKRACRMIADITSCSNSAARLHLEQSRGSVKIAVMLASGAKNTEVAETLLQQNEGRLGPAIEQLKNNLEHQ